MRRISGKVSLATRRIWGDPEDEDESSAITSSGSRCNGFEFTSAVKEGDHSESAHDDGILPENDSSFNVDCTSFPDLKLNAKTTFSGEALEKSGELLVVSKKQTSPIDEKYPPPLTELYTSDEILDNPSTKIPLLEQTPLSFEKTGVSSFHKSISSSVVRLPLSYHDASDKEFAPCNATKLTKDHSEASQILQDINIPIEILHQYSKENNEEPKASGGTAEEDNWFFAPKPSNPQEKVFNTDGPFLGEYTNDLVIEGADEKNSLNPTAIMSDDIISRNCDPPNSESKFKLNSYVSVLGSDNIPEIVSSKLSKLESCDEIISTILESETPEESFILEIESQSICKSSLESQFQLCSEELDYCIDTLNVVEPISFNNNCTNLAHMSSAATDLPDLQATENKKNDEESLDKETITSLNLSNETISLDKALPLSSHIKSKNNTRDSVSLDDEKSSRCTEITDYSSEELAKSITSDSLLNFAKLESKENSFADHNVHEVHLRSQITDLSNEEVDESYTLITVFNDLSNKVRVSDTKTTDKQDTIRGSSNKINECENTLLTNFQDPKENDNDFSLSNADKKYDCIQYNGLILSENVDQHLARVETIAYEDSLSVYDNKPNDISSKGIEEAGNLSEANYTVNEESSLNHNSENINSTEISGKFSVDTDNSKISVKDLKLYTDKNDDNLKDFTGAEIETEDRTEEKIEIAEDTIEGNAKDNIENQVIDNDTNLGEIQARDDIEANVFMSEASKPENKGDRNDYIKNEVDGLKYAHKTDFKIGNDVKIEPVVPVDQKFGKDDKKNQLEGAELSETETLKTTRNRKTWLRYVKSFEKRHEEGDSSSTKLGSARESSRRLDRGDNIETIASTPKIPETPMKKKYAPSQSGSTTPDKRRRSFRKKIKEKISDTLHKLKD